MFEKKRKIDDRYIEGMETGEAKAYARIKSIIDTNKMEDFKAVLLAIKIICEYELMDNPFTRDVTFFKPEIKEI